MINNEEAFDKVMYGDEARPTTDAQTQPENSLLPHSGSLLPPHMPPENPTADLHTPHIPHLPRGHEASEEPESPEESEELEGLQEDEELVGSLVVQSAAKVQPQPVSWLWEGFLPRGKIVIFDGDPSVGKSTVALDVAARLTSGGMWPDGTTVDAPENVILLAGEDGAADTVIPRLNAAGADLERVTLINCAMTDEDTRTGVQFDKTMFTSLKALIAEKHAALMIVDVLMSFLGNADGNKDGDIRGKIMQPMSNLANKTGCTFLCIRHLNKSGSGSAIYRGGGSIGIVGAARAAYMFKRDPDSDACFMAPEKLNLAKMPPSFSYELEDCPEHHVARVKWGEAREGMTADTFLSLDSEDADLRDERAQWLYDLLEAHDGYMFQSDVVEAGKSNNPRYSSRQIQRTVANSRAIRKTREAKAHAKSIYFLPSICSEEEAKLAIPTTTSGKSGKSGKSEQFQGFPAGKSGGKSEIISGKSEQETQPALIMNMEEWFGSLPTFVSDFDFTQATTAQLEHIHENHNGTAWRNKASEELAARAADPTA